MNITNTVATLSPQAQRTLVTIQDTAMKVNRELTLPAIWERTEREIQHLQRLGKELGRKDAQPIAARERQLLQITQAGFIWFVDHRFVERMRYAATVGSRTRMGMRNPLVRTPDGSGIWYAGDIPDFALDNIEKAKECRLQDITIHSNMPLPVQIEEIEPVLVGWLQQPRIVCQRGRSPRCWCESHELGVVLAFWDMDMEINIL